MRISWEDSSPSVAICMCAAAWKLTWKLILWIKMITVPDKSFNGQVLLASNTFFFSNSRMLLRVHHTHTYVLFELLVLARMHALRTVVDAAWKAVFCSWYNRAQKSYHGLPLVKELFPKQGRSEFLLKSYKSFWWTTTKKKKKKSHCQCL